MIESQQFPLIAKTMAELEDVLAEELIGLGADNVEIGTRMVSFTGDKALMYKANIYCRTALRILKPIHSFKAESAEEVYGALKEVNWEEYLSLDTTFSIDAVVYSHIFTHSKFVAYKVKDAIADWFMERYGKRPTVSLTNPDMVFNIHISHNKCTLSLDSSGESLHKRGYRVTQTEAPISEVLAAGMILKSGWRGESILVDPMCGSGTILIEAAMIALGIPPGIHRQHFAFERWKDFDQELFSHIYNDDSGAKEFKHRIIGSDSSSVAISIAESNIRNAGLKKYIDLSVRPFQQYTEPPAPEGVVITNPPYGERIKVEELEELYGMIGERLKHVFTGFNAYILSYRKESFDAIALKHTRRFFLYNGALECEMREYEIFSGKRKEHSREERPRNRRDDTFLKERNSKEGYRRSRREEQEEREVPAERSERRSFDPDRKLGRRPSDSDRKPSRTGSEQDRAAGRGTFNSERKPVHRSSEREHDGRRSFGRSDDKPKSFQKKTYGKREENSSRDQKGDGTKKVLRLHRSTRKGGNSDS